MRNFLEAVWWWTRVAALALAGLYFLALLFNNARETATLWYWFGYRSDRMPIITIVLVSFLAGAVVGITAWALTSAMITYRRTRDERRTRVAIERDQEMHRKAAMLRTKPAPQPMPQRPATSAPPPARERLLPSTVLSTDPTNVSPHEADNPPIAVAPPQPTPVPAATRDVDREPIELEPVAVADDPTPAPLVDEPVLPADENESGNPDRSRLPPASPPPAGG